MSDTAIRGSTLPSISTRSSSGGWFRNPWRRPWVLATVTWGYLAWSILPVIIAIIFSFNAGRSRSSWQGLLVSLVVAGS